MTKSEHADKWYYKGVEVGMDLYEKRYHAVIAKLKEALEAVEQYLIEEPDDEDWSEKCLATVQVALSYAATEPPPEPA